MADRKTTSTRKKPMRGKGIPKRTSVSGPKKDLWSRINAAAEAYGRSYSPGIYKEKMDAKKRAYTAAQKKKKK